jgi:DNA-binding transcriptional ArsR family regulator
VVLVLELGGRASEPEGTLLAVPGWVEEKLELAASKLRAISHPMRIAIIELLSGDKHLSVTEIYKNLEIEQATASHHLNILKNKGVLVYHRRRIKVKTVAEKLPNFFELDVTDLDVGDNILIRDINFPEGVECYINPSVPVVGVVKAK